MLAATTRALSQLRKYSTLIADSIPIIKNFLVYASGALILRSITIITAPITMSIVSPAEYGLLALINSFISIACIVCGFGLRQALSLEYFHRSKQEQLLLVNDIILTYTIIAVPLMILATWLHPLINHYCLLNTAPTYLVLLSILLIFIYFFTELVYQVLQYEGKALVLTVVQTGVALITVAINLWLLWYVKLGIASIIIGQLCGMLLLCCGVGYYLRSSWNVAHALHSWKSMYAYFKLGLPFIPGMLCAWLLAAGDRWVLARYATLHDVGIYSVADTFGQLFQMVILLPFSNAYLPSLMKKFAQADDIMAVEKTNRMLMWLFMPCCIGLVVLGYWISKPFLLWFLPPLYHQALSYVCLLLVGYIFLMSSYFAAARIQFYKKCYFLAFALCVPAVLNICLNLLMVPSWGIMGCVLATVFSYALYFIIIVAYNYRLA